jgi:hypothetical protein
MQALQLLRSRSSYSTLATENRFLHCPGELSIHSVPIPVEDHLRTELSASMVKSNFTNNFAVSFDLGTWHCLVSSMESNVSTKSIFIRTGLIYFIPLQGYVVRLLSQTESVLATGFDTIIQTYEHLSKSQAII